MKKRLEESGKQSDASCISYSERFTEMEEKNKVLKDSPDTWATDLEERFFFVQEEHTALKDTFVTAIEQQQKGYSEHIAAIEKLHIAMKEDNNALKNNLDTFASDLERQQKVWSEQIATMERDNNALKESFKELVARTEQSNLRNTQFQLEVRRLTEESERGKLESRESWKSRRRFLDEYKRSVLELVESAE